MILRILLVFIFILVLIIVYKFIFKQIELLVVFID